LELVEKRETGMYIPAAGKTVEVCGVVPAASTAPCINLLRRIKSEPGYLSGKKVLIWCFAAREFTESLGCSVLKLPQ
jgi:hypothetical protein